MKTKKIQLVALLVAFIIGIAGIFVSLSLHSASAATYSASSLFTSPDTGSLETNANEALKLVFKDGSTVRYNRDLAYKWVVNNDDNDTYEKGENYFSMEFSFDSVNFSEFSVKFQSSENSVTKEEVAENEIVFFENGQYAFRNAGQKDVESKDLEKKGEAVDLTGKTVKINFAAGAKSGEYTVTVSVNENSASGTFTNIAGTYAEYVASEVVPLSFKATLKEGASEQKLTLKELNKQTFVLDGDKKVVDNAAPVLALNDDVKSFILGTKLLNFTYETIDVCCSTVKTTTEYYQYDPSDTKADWTSLTSSVKIFETALEDGSSILEQDGKEYVSVRFILKDDENNSLTYYIADYAESTEDCYEKTVGEGENAEKYSFTAVITDDEAPSYTFYQKAIDNTLTFDQDAFNAFVDAYQAAVDTAAEEQRAGDGYYFYLPSLMDYIEDNDTSYTGLKFNIFYKYTTTGSQTKLAYNALKFPVSKAGKYVFKVVASDKSGNVMQYLNDDERWADVTSDVVWDIDEIPAFTFTAENRGLEIEDLETASYAYKGSNYSAKKFTVKGSDYEDEFKLCYLDGVTPGNISYNEIVDFANDYHDEDFVSALKEKYSSISGEAAFTEISPWDSDGPTDEDDKGWETHDNRYEWRESSFSFTPQDTGYYVIVGKYVDNDTTEVVYAYEVVYVSSETDKNYGEIYWIEDNVVTVVFIVIAAVSLIGIVVLLVIKPAEKTAESGNKKSKSGKFSAKKKNKKDE